MKKLLLALFCTMVVLLAQAQSTEPREVLVQFFKALDNKNFSDAYKLCSGKRWGTLTYFSSSASYGGISGVDIESIDQQEVNNSDATFICITSVIDMVNGTGSFKQAFTLKKQRDNKWLITGVKLIESNRAVDNLNLNAAVQKDFSMADVRRLTKSIYDTLENVSPTENPDDIMKRTFKNLKFIETGKGLYAIAIVENQGPQYGVYTGWCDAFAFKKNNEGWQLSDFLLQAGGGGRMGFPGQFERIIRIGDAKAGIVISSYIGQSGIEVVRESIVTFEDGALSYLTTVATDYSIDGSFGSASIRLSNQYRFERKGSADYDLLIEQFDVTGKKPRKVKSNRIVYKNGYKIPDSYEFES